MPTFYSPASLRNVAINEAVKRGLTPNIENFSRSLKEKVANKTPTFNEKFDIFLSYRAEEVQLVIGIYSDLIRRGYTVYLDRVMDAHLDRSNVSRSTCETLRMRLMQSKALFYVSTDNASDSKWMPWELGFEDGYRGKAAILPVTDRSEFPGVEFVSLYPKIEPSSSSNFLWVYEADGKTLIGTFDSWKDSVPSRKCGMPVCPIPK